MALVQIELLQDNQENDRVADALKKHEIKRYLRPEQVGSLAAGLGGFGSTEVGLEDSSRIWIADPEEGFKEAFVVERKEKEDKIIVKHKNFEGVMEKLTLKMDEAQEMNPSAFEYSEDMASLTNLNEASVLHNLRQRFMLDLIHTTSGLFCVTINPWRWLPLYTKDIILMYAGTAENRPPHIYSIANVAYTNILHGLGNQSILITGESGAGKTENTKKLIQYFTMVAGSSVEMTKKNTVSLEDQILEMNPVLEAFGNAKTTQNDNSSRFGKFIRIKFDSSGKVAGAEVECYLLEKSRVISQNPGERCFHIFYQLLSEGICDEIKDLLKLKKEPEDYRLINQGDSCYVECIDDEQEMLHTDRALDVLGFSADEKLGLYQMTAACLLAGQMKFREISADQCVIEGMHEANDVCNLLGLDSRKFVAALTEPTVKVGDELIHKTQNYKQTLFSIGAVSKSLYEKCFFWIVKRCNESMKTRPKGGRRRSVTVVKSASMTASKVRFIGVLDIAGFEILGVNSFEQLCINFTNERLQQYFNHFMFIKEQGEYEAEQIQWDYIDFGLDLQAAIDLIEKPLGILSLLEEQCMVPKGSDDGFAQKLLQEHLGKSDKLGRPKRSQRSSCMAHFSIAHYAGTVNYSAEGWLDKNKDPLNDCMLQLLRSSFHKLLSTLFQASPEERERKASIGTNGRNRPMRSSRSGAFSTVSAVYRSQLATLLQTLNTTSPHFIRCIVPNYEKEPRILNAGITLHQLRCNGVLEGIRICRRGYPNRVLYEEFKNRYRIFGPDIVDRCRNDPKECTMKLCQKIELQPYTQYQLGLTKIFCRVGLIGKLERQRNDSVAAAITGLQARIRGFLEIIKARDMKQQVEATKVVQFNMKHWVGVRQWAWFRLMLRVIPLIPTEKEATEEMKALEGAREELQSQLEKYEKENALLRSEVAQLEAKVEKVLENTKKCEVEMNVMKYEMSNQEDLVHQMQKNIQDHDRALQELSDDLSIEKKRVTDLKSNTGGLEGKLSELELSLQKERNARQELEHQSSNTETELKSLQWNLHELQNLKSTLESTISEKENEGYSLSQVVKEQKEQIAKLNKIIKDKDGHIDDLEISVQDEKTAKRRVEKAKASLEEDYNELDAKLRDAGRHAAVLREGARRKDQDINRITQQVNDLKNQNEVQINDLRRRHQSASKEVQKQFDEMHRKSLKLESENQKLRSQMEKKEKSYERDYLSDSDYMSRSRTYGGYRRRNYTNQIETVTLQNRLQESMYRSRSTSSTSDVLTRRIEELERENRESDRDKRMMKRQLEVAKTALQDETEEKETLVKMVKSLRTDSDKLNNNLMHEEENNEELERQLRKAQNEMLHWKHKCEESLLEKESELDSERKRMRQKLDDASAENMSKTGHLSTMEKTYAQLQEELKDSEIELERTYATINNLQKVQKTQDKALDRWGNQYRITSSELETLREENMELRTKLRSQQKQLEALKGIGRQDSTSSRETTSDVCHDQGMDLDATILENDIKRLHNDLNSMNTSMTDSIISDDRERSAAPSDDISMISGFTS